MSDVLSTEEFLMFNGLSLIGLGCDFNILPSLARRSCKSTDHINILPRLARRSCKSTDRQLCLDTWQTGGFGDEVIMAPAWCTRQNITKQDNAGFVLPV